MEKEIEQIEQFAEIKMVDGSVDFVFPAVAIEINDSNIIIRRDRGEDYNDKRILYVRSRVISVSFRKSKTVIFFNKIG